MDTGNGLTERLLGAVATRPAAPGLAVVAVLLIAAGSGWSVLSVDWFWPACAALIVLAVVMNAVRQDLWRRVQTHEHQQRMGTANDLLNEHSAAVEPDRITGSIRELGGLVEKFGHKLDDLLAEVHAENAAAQQGQHRS
jgi:ABC-type nickel/cobalt efflux system permease component RcnA